MGERANQLKCDMGALMLKLHQHGKCRLAGDEESIGKQLAANRLARFVGTEPVYGPKPIADAWKDAQVGANSYWELTGEGESLRAKHSEADLIAGHFLLPGESQQQWQDRGWGRILIGIVIGVVVTVSGAVILYVLKLK